MREPDRVRRWWLLALPLILVAACGDDSTTEEDAAERPETASSASEDTGDDDEGAASDADEAWCATVIELREDPDATLGDLRAAAGSAPEAVADTMEVLGSQDASLGVAQRLDAAAQVEAWSHEHCGTEHPFCTAWTQYSGAVAALALSGTPEEDVAVATGELEDLLRVVRSYAPSDLDPHLEVVSETQAGAVSDTEEREAEASWDALDAWVDDTCGASG